MYDTLKEILVDRFSVEESAVTAQATLEDLGLTSLDVVEFADIVSGRFAVGITDDEVLELERIDKIAALIERRMPSTR